MTGQPIDDPLMKQAIRVRDDLARRYLPRPGVSLVEISFTSAGQGSPRTPVVRVHVKDDETRAALDIPELVGGIPVQVLVSNFKLE